MIREEAIELGNELAQFKRSKIFAHLRVKQQASYLEKLNQLTRAALKSTDLRVRGLALDVLKTTSIWDELDAIQVEFDRICTEDAPATEPRSEYEYVTP